MVLARCHALNKLIKRKIKRVVIGMPDPNRTVHGNGWAMLRLKETSTLPTSTMT